MFAASVEIDRKTFLTPHYIIFYFVGVFQCPLSSTGLTPRWEEEAIIMGKYGGVGCVMECWSVGGVNILVVTTKHLYTIYVLNM